MNDFSKFRKNYIKIVLICLVFLVFNVKCGNQQVGTEEESKHFLSDVIEGFHCYSYYAGIIYCAAEFVGAGCKQLALSSPYTEEELKVLIKPARMAADEYGLPIYVEKDFLITKLFDPSLTEDKAVIFIAQNQSVLDEYFALKKLKEKAVNDGTIDKKEDELAWKFGKLLSYDDKTINRLLSESKKR